MGPSKRLDSAVFVELDAAMKSWCTSWLIATVVTLALGICDGQVLQAIYSFTNTNGASPVGALTLGTDGNYYGVTSSGGAGYCGTIFRLTPEGQFTTVFSFNGTNGANPAASLTCGDDGYLYGTTSHGGITNAPNASGMGTIFKFSTNGTLTTLVFFNQDNGAQSQASLTLAPDGSFYGTTMNGGITNSRAGSLPAGFGTIFNVTSNGVLTTLARFGGTNGYESRSSLTLGSDGAYYGTTVGGTNGTGSGTLFSVTTDGNLKLLAAFDVTNGAPGKSLTAGADGELYGTTRSNYYRIDSSGAIEFLGDFNSSNSVGSLTLRLDGNFYGAGVSGIFYLSTNGLITNVVTFTARDGHSINPIAIDAEGTIYGTSISGGSENAGTVFRVSSDGGLDTLFSFDGINGANPWCGLTLGGDGDLYGTTQYGGSGYGTVFRITRDGRLTTLARFDGFTQGAHPRTGVTLGPDGRFYGTTPEQGTRGAYPCYNDGQGTIYAVTTNGALTTLFSFNDATNGAMPEAPLILGNDSFLYGTTRYAGMDCIDQIFGGYTGQLTGYGTVFKIATNGAFTSLAALGGYYGQYPASRLTEAIDGSFYGCASVSGVAGNYGAVFKMNTNHVLTYPGTFKFTNGYLPMSKLVFANDGYMYGTTSWGGISNAPNREGMGVIFRTSTNGNITPIFQCNSTNSGIGPVGGLLIGSDGWLYGATAEGGISNAAARWGWGTIYKISTNGVFNTLAVFEGTNGAFPRGDLISGGDGYLYGAAYSGGNGYGTVFRLLLQPTITVQPTGQTNVAGAAITLSCGATNLAGAALQWRLNGTNIDGATNASFTIPAARLGDSGAYTVAVINAAGTTISATAVVRVLPPGALTLQNAGGYPALNLFGTTGRNYEVQYSTDLFSTNWVDLLSVSNMPTSPYPIGDSNGFSAPYRFYRTIEK